MFEKDLALIFWESSIFAGAGQKHMQKLMSYVSLCSSSWVAAFNLAAEREVEMNILLSAAISV